jgi:hypothetical protein
VIGTFLLYPSRSIILLALYAIISAVWGAIIAGGSGSDWNSIFDLIISLTLIIGLILDKQILLKRFDVEYANRLHLSIIIILIISLGIHAPLRYIKGKKTIRNIHRATSEFADGIDYLASKKGSVMCEDLSLCYWSGKDYEMDFFNTGQKIQTDVIQEKKLFRLFEQKYFSAIQVNKSDAKSPRLPRSVNGELLKYYEISRTSTYAGVFLIPKKE